MTQGLTLSSSFEEQLGKGVGCSILDLEGQSIGCGPIFLTWQEGGPSLNLLPDRTGWQTAFRFRSSNLSFLTSDSSPVVPCFPLAFRCLGNEIRP